MVFVRFFSALVKLLQDYHLVKNFRNFSTIGHNGIDAANSASNIGITNICYSQIPRMNQNWIRISSTFSVLRPTLLRLFSPNFTSTSLVRPKLYFDLYFSTNKKSRFDKMSKYRGRSKDIEVQKRSN